jgi:BirA family transcriptional regulator, biotin operon repressor / biotin---[acetyl-CoA-carboxylase] ligase
VWQISRGKRLSRARADRTLRRILSRTSLSDRCASIACVPLAVDNILTFALLRLLARGEACSGEELALALGCSQASVCGALRDLEALGLEVIRVRGGGYRLAEVLDLIDRGELASRLSHLPFSIEVLDQCASTNTLLTGRAKAGAEHMSVLACEHQSEGRGRRGNGWISAPGASLAFSLLWRFSNSVDALSGLSLAVGVGVARSLESLGFRPVGLKWPNDLLFTGRKLGGILIEVDGVPLGPSAAVIGIGLNIKLPASVRERIDIPVADLAEIGPLASRTVLLASLLEGMAAVLERVSQAGFAPFRKEWLARHSWQGKRVTIDVAGRPVAEGEATDVGEDGALVLRTANGVERFYAGELSLRRA